MKQKDFDFFDKPEVINILKIVGYISLAMVVIAGFFIKGHGHFSFESIPGFWPIFGFIACVLIVVISKTIGHLFLERKEGYYD